MVTLDSLSDGDAPRVRALCSAARVRRTAHRQHLRARAGDRRAGDVARVGVSVSPSVEARARRDQDRSLLHGRGAAPLPALVGFAFTYALIEPARSLDLPFTRVWPHGLPIWLQAVLMILVVDFVRYWIHRWEHENDTLWRLHSVHHSVEQLYWLNTARFHPLEKALQMLADSLPFLLMAVDERVLALSYVVCHEGFFQHCNIHLRYGPLNYIVGSAETHRWHHSRVPRESNANYGSTVVVWDVLFGTWYLPDDREIAELGLQDPSYPKSFFRLLRAPFKPVP